MTRASRPLLDGQPADKDGPTFTEAWEAQAFAMTIALHEKGLFTWPEWAAALAREIKRAQAAGDPDLGTTYYSHWLKALEALIVEKGVTSARALDETTAAWEDAARLTPHGKPILLKRGSASLPDTHD